MRWADYALVPLLLVAFWLAGALAAAGVYVGDVAPAGTELPAMVGELLFVLASLSVGAFVGAGLWWPFRMVLWIVLLIVIAPMTTMWVVSDAMNSPTCPTCDTAAVVIAPVLLAMVAVVLLLLIPVGYGLRVGAGLLWRRHTTARRSTRA